MSENKFFIGKQTIVSYISVSNGKNIRMKHICKEIIQ